MAQTAKKMNKPLMEKKRRARINSCLSELKTLVLQEMKKDQCSRISYSKLEKADILEMTVQYLRNLQRQQIISAASMDPGVIEKYVSGYTECTHEVTRYMNLMEGIDNDSKQYLMKHLNSGVQMVSGTKNVLRATTIPSEATLSPTADAACIKRVVTSPVVEALHAQAPSSPVADPYNCHKQISHHTSLSVEALERLSLLPNPNQQDSSMSQCLSYTHVVTDGLTPIDIKPRVNDSVVTTIVSPKDFESTDSGICDRVDDCSNSSMSSSSDQERDSRIYCSDQYTDKTDVNNNDLPISDISEDDEFVWRPW